MAHHTKDKGDQGIGFTIANLIQHGIGICVPLSEHLPFDLFACYPDGEVKRVSEDTPRCSLCHLSVLLLDF